MVTLTSVAAMRARAGALAAGGDVIALVPTMGALHEGHLSLIRIASGLADVAVVSVFVNPTQFGPSEDFDRYPRDLARDSSLAEAAGCDVLFAPSASEMYPAGFATSVRVAGMGEKLCGGFRPGHFDGVTTVVAKLISIVRPRIAVFGQKDGQQVAIIERMTEDLDLGVVVIRAPTVREADGLAMSSRNAYLSVSERAEAAVLFRALEAGRALYEGGETEAARVVGHVERAIAEGSSAAIDYVAAVDSRSLEDLARLRPGAMIAAAARFGKTRLIDNVVLGEAPAARP